MTDAIRLQGSALNRTNEFTNVLISGSEVGISSVTTATVRLQKVLIADDVTTPLVGFPTGAITGTFITGKAGYIGNGDYHLGPESDAIDAGDPDPTIVRDLDGTPRPIGAANEIGAYEFTPQSQSITFNALPDRTLDQSPFTLNATATSNLPVTFTSTTPDVCTTSGTNGSTVTLIAEGTCIIVASQPGNSLFSPAPDVTRRFTVSAAPTGGDHNLYLPSIDGKEG